jgi:hypothetical protein
MARRTLGFALAVLALLSSPSLAALQITNVSANPKTLATAEQDPIQVTFRLSEPAMVSLRIYDGRDLLIRKLDSAGVLKSGDNQLAWDLRDQAGRTVPPEAYRFTLFGETEDGERIEHDLTDLTAGDDVRATEVAWHPQEKVIRYRLPEPARVNIRVGLQNNGPLLRTVVDWVVRDAGPQQQKWDGLDASGVLDLGDHRNLEIAVDAFGFSDNSILVGPPADRVQLIEDMPWGEQRRVVKRQGKKRMHFHRQQPLETRGDYRVNLTLPADLPLSPEGLPMVNGILPVRLDISDEDRERALARRFEPVFFVDGTFAFENEIGFLPMTWRWDTEGVNEGVHYLTANLRGYEGNFGMATVRVLVRHSDQETSEESHE